MLDRVLASLRAFHGRLGRGSPGGRVIADEDLLAALAPSCPRRSFPNCVVYRDADAVVARHDELTAAYRDAGVRAWTVWVPEADRDVARALAGAGHALDAGPRAMAARVGAVMPPAPLPGATVERPEETAALAALNEEAYGVDPGEFAGIFGALAGGDVRRYLIRRDGVPAACAGAIHVEGDCHVVFVATAGAHRRQGLASALMGEALRDAATRGCATTTLVATAAGRSIYARMGYGDFGALEMWERRLR